MTVRATLADRIADEADRLREARAAEEADERASWCAACQADDHSGHDPDDDGACGNENAFNADCRCPGVDEDAEAREAGTPADEPPWAPVPTHDVERLIAARPDMAIEVVFPTVYEEDRTSKIKDLVTANAVGVISHQRMSEQMAKELGVEDYNYASEQQQIKTEGPMLQGLGVGSTGPVGIGDTIAQRVVGLGKGGGGGSINIGSTAPGLAADAGSNGHRADLSGVAKARFRRQQREARALTVDEAQARVTHARATLDAIARQHDPVAGSMAPLVRSSRLPGWPKARRALRLAEEQLERAQARAREAELRAQVTELGAEMRRLREAFAAEQHPRAPAGSPEGGQFVPSGQHQMNGQHHQPVAPAEAAATPPAPAQHVDDLVGMLAAPDGGFTVNVGTHESPTTGYVVSVYPDRAKTMDLAALDEVKLGQFIKDNADVLGQMGAYFGAWHDPETHKIWLDISVHRDTAEAAAALARERGQIAYFDLAAGKSVTVGRRTTEAAIAQLEHRVDELAQRPPTQITVAAPAAPPPPLVEVIVPPPPRPMRQHVIRDTEGRITDIVLEPIESDQPPPAS